MTREQAWELAQRVADLGLSVSLEIGVHPSMSPPEHCSVHPHATRFEPTKINALMELAEEYGLELHLPYGGLRLAEVARPGGGRL